MAQPPHSKKWLLNILLALALLLAEREGKPSTDEPQGEAAEPRLAKEPYVIQRFLAFLDRHVDGTLELPTKERVRAVVGPSKNPRLREQAMKHVLEELEHAAEQSNKRMKTTMVASAFALTTAGLLLQEKADIWVPLTVSAGVFAFIGVVAALFGHEFHVGKRPVQRVCMADVLNGRACLVRKEFYAKLAAILATLALLLQGASVVVRWVKPAHERQTMTSLTKNTTAPTHAITIAIPYNGYQASPHRVTGTERKSAQSPAREMSSRHLAGRLEAHPSLMPR